MKRSELLRRILALPADADIGVQIGDDHLDISDVVAWGTGRSARFSVTVLTFVTSSWPGSQRLPVSPFTTPSIMAISTMSKALVPLRPSCFRY
ncbi:hypothetical protein [Actinoplanes sp. NPDC051411]|uniref:hypothetical protein n=1 Tax=Actinoplanes sp. NPDC051411 TaxID=3155522 RepID=UPI00343C73A1